MGYFILGSYFCDFYVDRCPFEPDTAVRDPNVYDKKALPRDREVEVPKKVTTGTKNEDGTGV
jgi:hypothetical protein